MTKLHDYHTKGERNPPCLELDMSYRHTEAPSKHLYISSQYPKINSQQARGHTHTGCNHIRPVTIGEELSVHHKHTQCTQSHCVTRLQIHKSSTTEQEVNWGP